MWASFVLVFPMARFVLSGSWFSTWSGRSSTFVRAVSMMGFPSACVSHVSANVQSSVAEQTAWTWTEARLSAQAASARSGSARRRALVFMGGLLIRPGGDGRRLAVQDAGRDEDEELGVVVLLGGRAEERAEERDLREERHLGAAARGLAGVDAADDGRLAVLHEHLRLPLRDRGLPVRAGELRVRGIVGRLDLEEDRPVGRDVRRDLELELRLDEGRVHARRRGLRERDGDALPDRRLLVADALPIFGAE